jgi:hypothetical protein
MVTFQVSDVACERTRLPTSATASQLAKLGWRPDAYCIAAPELIGNPAVHPLALAVHLAFAQHRPLVLTPDAVWLCIAQSLATHIELNAEALRSRFVRHAGKLALEVRRDGFVPCDPANDWPGVVDDLVAQIRGHIGGRADLFVASFSTTGPLDRTASQIALMGAMREYFSYSLMTLCGIPEITLTGTPEDWASIRRRAEAFREFDLAWWVEALEPVLAQLEATARGHVDREFWRRLYKLESASGGDRMFGWLNTLFAYVDDPPRRNTFPTFDGSGFAGNRLDDLPHGRTCVPFIWNQLGTPVDMELVGGMWGVTQDAQGALGVASGWLVSLARRVPPGSIHGTGSNLPPRPLALRDPAVAETLASLRDAPSDEPTELSLPRTERLRSLDGIQHLRGLVTLSIAHAPLLETIAPLTGMRSIKSLYLGGCPRLANVGPVLETLPYLDMLSLARIPALRLADVLPIAKMRCLRHVALMGCTGLPEHIRYLYQEDDVVDLQAEIARLAGLG